MWKFWLLSHPLQTTYADKFPEKSWRICNQQEWSLMELREILSTLQQKEDTKGGCWVDTAKTFVQDQLDSVIWVPSMVFF